MNQRMPNNLSGKLAEAWEALFARADAATGNVTIPASETVADLELLAATGGCTIGAPAEDGSRVVTLNFADTPAEPGPAVEEVVAATKKTEFAGEELPRE